MMQREGEKQLVRRGEGETIEETKLPSMVGKDLS